MNNKSNGIRVFLVLEENKKPVCYLCNNEVDYSENLKYDIMYRVEGNKKGISLRGKNEDKDLITKKLLKYHQKSLDNEKKELEIKNNLLKNIKIDYL